MCYTSSCPYEDAHGECRRGGFSGEPPKDAFCYEGDEDEIDIQSPICFKNTQA